MNKRIVSTVISVAVAISAFGSFSITASAEAKTPQYQTNARQMEQLNRGLIAVVTTADSKSGTKDGVYLSWRLFGTESLTHQAFDIYRDGTYIHTTEADGPTSWTDPNGTADNEYVVVKEDGNPATETPVKPTTNFNYATDRYSLGNAFTYMDILIERPADNGGGHYYTVDKDHQGGANDASVGDLDGDGDYEIVLKWDPTNSKDAAGGGATGRTYIDAYEIDPTNNDPSKNENGHLYKWRIDLGPHVRSGAHENPFLVYDFNGDGYAEIVSITGLGATDSKGEYVTKAGDTDEIKNADNTKTFLRKGKNIGPEYYTIFDGETGEAIVTTDAIPIGPNYDKAAGTYGPEDGSYFGDAKMNRSSRYLAAVAYLDGVHPSIIMCRGYYNRAMIRAYTWDGTEMVMQWEHNGGTKGSTLYGQGNHNLSVGDIDNDGKDEIVYGSAALDDDGKTVLGNTLLGHGDAMHLNDFNNDGIQEVFAVKEDGEGFKKYAEDLRVASTGEHFWAEKKIVTTDDNGRGVMDNIDDEYAKTHPNALALGWSSGKDVTHDLNGDDVAAKPTGGSRTFDNSLVYWDGDLGRELLDDNIICKYDASTGTTSRFYGPTDGYTLTGGSSNNYSKRNASLSADLWGDWREEVILPTGKGQNDTPALRIYTSVIPTEYRLATLMHDCQYRLAIAWQNVGYNQPPHTSYYIGSAALATDDGGNTLHYLAPATAYTKVTYEAPAQVAVTGVEIANKEITVEVGKTASIGASVIPAEATKKGISYTSSDESVAKASNGIVTGVGVGTATITATTKDGGFTAECEVTVFSNPVTGVALSDKLIELGIGNTATLTASVLPSNASDKSVVWSSDDDSVAEVNSEGVVTGVGLGKTTVTATAGDITAKCIVKVKPMNIVEATGEDVFVTTNALDDTVKFTGAKDSASLTLAKATVPIEFHKDFEAFNKNTATLSFHFTTGGAKEGNDYIWKIGHGYNSELKLLDTNGNNIFNIIEEHTSSGVATKYAVADGAAQAVSSWTKLSGDADSPWNRSQIRWDVKVTFDYTAGVGTINLAGCNNQWVRGETYETTFPLNGASFKTLKYETNNLTDWVSGTPKVEQLTYTSTEQVSGNTDVLYEKGTYNSAWQETDLEDWVQTGKDTAALQFDESNGRIWYNPVKPGAEYSAEKTFDVTPGAVVSYDVDWYFGSAVARDGNYEYLQLGNMRLGWTNGYKLMLSTDGGATYGADAVFTGENTTYTKNVKATFNTNTKTVTLLFDGVQIYSGVYSDADGNTADGANLVKLGFTKAGAAPDWEVPNGINKIRVAQFIEGEEAPDFSTITVTEKNGKTADASYELIDYAEETKDVTLVGALYDGNKLVEVKSKGITLGEAVNGIIKGTDSIEFTNDTENCNVKIFMWDTVSGQKPYADAVGK